jgi:hypothetical protein
MTESTHYFLSKRMCRCMMWRTLNTHRQQHI